MRRRIILTSLLCVELSVFISGCLPLQEVVVVPPVNESAPLADAGPYWRQSGSQMGPADALAYYAALKKLGKKEITQEKDRVRKGMEDPAKRLARLQLILLAVLPGHPVDGEPEQFVKFLEEARQDADLHHGLDDLFVLLDDVLQQWKTDRQREKQGRQALQASKKNTREQAAELEKTRRECEDLSEKLQKLQEIEQSIIDRGRNKQDPAGK